MHIDFSRTLEGDVLEPFGSECWSPSLFLKWRMQWLRWSHHISQPVGVGIDTQQVLEASNNHLISLASQSTSRCVDGTRWDTLDRTLDRLSQDTVILLGPYPETNCKWVGKLSSA